ncbi:MAG: trehalose-phosphatase [Nocardioidaceae bacterium]
MCLLTDGVLTSLTTEAGRAGLERILAEPRGTLAAFDYDGTLAPIVDDPGGAVPHPGVIAALGVLAAHVGQVAIVTGRPVDVAVSLGGLREAPGLDNLVVMGHYGLERWDAATDRVTRPDQADGVGEVRARLPELLRSAGVPDAEIEDKGLSVAVHVRRLGDPVAAFDAVRGPLQALAERTGLDAEPGRFVVELRPPGMDKGQALAVLIEETRAGSVVFVGDDLGDLAAFDAVDRVRREGVGGLLVCSGSTEVTAVAERADVVVDGPGGVAAFIAALAEAIDSRAP